MSIVGGGTVRIVGVALHVLDCDGFSDVFELEQSNAKLADLLRGFVELYKDEQQVEECHLLVFGRIRFS